MMQYFGGPIIGWPYLTTPIMENKDIYGETKHTYSLCLLHGPRKLEETFSTRENATARMYQVCNKYGMQITKIYDDKHDKSYFTNTGAEFHINRLF